MAGQTFAECLVATADEGHVINVGRLAGPSSTIDIDQLSHRGLTVGGVSFGSGRPAQLGAVMAGLTAL